MHRLSGQFQEMLAFTMLAVVISVFLVFSSLISVGPLGDTLKLQTSLQERENLRSGASVVMSSTYKDTGRTMMELAGLAVFTQNTTLDFGPVVGRVDVKKEFQDRMDWLFGKGKWRLYIPFIERPANVQVAFVIDTSASMCDDTTNIRDSVPAILDSLRAQGSRAEVTVYLLPSAGNEQCAINGVRQQLTCANLNFPMRDDFNCVGLNGPPLDCSMDIPPDSQSSEAWAQGSACAARYGPKNGWKEGAVRIVMPVSDEITSGSECSKTDPSCTQHLCDSRESYIDTMIKAAKENNVKIFPLRADPCGSASGLGNPFICSCGQTVLPEFMKKAAGETGGQYSNISDYKSTAETIANILGSQVSKVKSIELGTSLEVPKSAGKQIYSYEIPIPVSSLGKYTSAYFYAWT